MNSFKKLFPTRLFVLATLLLLAETVQAQILFSDNFDVNSAANYTVNQDPDAEVLFSYDYSTLGISAAPNSTGGSTFGVRFRANIDATTGAQAINISPTGQSFIGNYRMSFDLWVNANGPFPAGGGGSTQFGTAGVGTAGVSVQKSSVPADGAWFAVDGEGQSGIDFRAYRSASSEGPTSTAYVATDSGAINRRSADNPYYHTAFPGGQQAPTLQQTTYPASADPASNQEGALKAGTAGFGWRQIEIIKVGNDVSWTIDGLPIATLTGATLAGNNIFVGHWDVFASTTANPAMNFSLVDNWRVEVVPEPSTWLLGFLGAAGLFWLRQRKGNRIVSLCVKKIALIPALVLSLTLCTSGQVYLNELLFNPVGTDAPHEYLELRGTPGLSLSGYYLLGVEGDIASNPGDVQNIFSLGAFSLGANGFLVGFQKGTLHSGLNAGANAFTNTGTGSGWGSGAGSDIGHSADSSATDVENASATYMIINIGGGAAPDLTLDLDIDDNGILEMPAGWSILDSVGVTDAATDVSYGALTFRATGLGTASGNTVDLAYTTGSFFLARKGDSTGSTANDWVEGSVSGTGPGFTFHPTEVTDPSFAGKALSDMALGGTNPIPEPSTYVLGTLGLAAFCFLRRRK